MLMNINRILENVNRIKDSNISHKEKENALHELERKNQNLLFIKTDLCPNCGHLTVDVWIKKERFSLEKETDNNGLSKHHRPPKNNFGTLDENIDGKENINP